MDGKELGLGEIPVSDKEGDPGERQSASPQSKSKPEVIKEIEGTEKKDLDRDILKPLIKKGSLYAYDSPEIDLKESIMIGDSVIDKQAHRGGRM